MPSIAVVLKQEIHRLAKKATKAELDALRQSVLLQKRQLSALKKELASLRRDLARAPRERTVSASAAPDEDASQKLRFVAKGFRSLRARLGLTLDEMAQLLGVSAQSVYNWEHERARPRPAQVQAIAELRALGKRKVRARLAEAA